MYKIHTDWPIFFFGGGDKQAMAVFRGPAALDAPLDPPENGLMWILCCQICIWHWMRISKIHFNPLIWSSVKGRWRRALEQPSTPRATVNSAHELTVASMRPIDRWERSQFMAKQPTCRRLVSVAGGRPADWRTGSCQCDPWQICCPRGSKDLSSANCILSYFLRYHVIAVWF